MNIATLHLQLAYVQDDHTLISVVCLIDSTGHGTAVIEMELNQRIHGVALSPRQAVEFFTSLAV
jgi:hypothetical protein